MGKGILVVLSGPSGTGKGTICKSFLDKNKDVKLSVSCTTRTPRDGEVHGVNYFFTEKEKFEDMIKKDEFLEYANVYGNYYGTPKAYVDDMLNKGYDVILEIDTQGALNVKEKFEDGVYIFIMPPSLKELENRIVGRGSETEETLKKRLGAVTGEIKLAEKYNYAVINDTIDEAVKKIESIIIAEKCKIHRAKNNIQVFKEVN